MGGLATRLVAMGLATREPGIGHALQRRLIPEGKWLFAQGTVIAEDILAASFRNLTAPERDQLMALIDKVLADGDA